MRFWNAGLDLAGVEHIGGGGMTVLGCMGGRALLRVGFRSLLSALSALPAVCCPEAAGFVVGSEEDRDDFDAENRRDMTGQRRG